jgi:hypothetical protein
MFPREEIYEKILVHPATNMTFLKVKIVMMRSHLTYLLPLNKLSTMHGGATRAAARGRRGQRDGADAAAMQTVPDMWVSAVQFYGSLLLLLQPASPLPCTPSSFLCAVAVAPRSTRTKCPCSRGAACRRPRAPTWALRVSTLCDTRNGCDQQHAPVFVCVGVHSLHDLRRSMCVSMWCLRDTNAYDHAHSHPCVRAGTRGKRGPALSANSQTVRREQVIQEWDIARARRSISMFVLGMRHNHISVAGCAYFHFMRW